MKGSRKRRRHRRDRAPSALDPPPRPHRTRAEAALPARAPPTPGLGPRTPGLDPPTPARALRAPGGEEIPTATIPAAAVPGAAAVTQAVEDPAEAIRAAA